MLFKIPLLLDPLGWESTSSFINKKKPGRNMIGKMGLFGGLCLVVLGRWWGLQGSEMCELTFPGVDELGWGRKSRLGRYFGLAWHDFTYAGFGKSSSTSFDFRPGKFTPLHNLAASAAPLPVFQLLVDFGAQVEAKDAAGWNLMHFAAKQQNKVAVRFAREMGLDPEEKVGWRELKGWGWRGTG